MFQLEEIGANFVVCQAGIDDPATHLLLQSNTGGVRYVSEKEIEVRILINFLLTFVNSYSSSIPDEEFSNKDL